MNTIGRTCIGCQNDGEVIPQGASDGITRKKEREIKDSEEVTKVKDGCKLSAIAQSEVAATERNKFLLFSKKQAFIR
ncbi:hypothetical protein RUM43_000974 [Polyplax serrata]|uniref:Uncharacterized protein n=1 Tax=Polyplax serrata TaxID=468196 RepID=A0AAN8SFH8_POLSC